MTLDDVNIVFVLLLGAILLVLAWKGKRHD